jgi:site-specific recombinase XerC
MGIPADLRLYDATRHSIASQLGNSGVSLLTISEMLGHASLETTKKYTHLDVHGLRVELEKRSLKTTVHELSMDNNRLH